MQEKTYGAWRLTTRLVACDWRLVTGDLRPCDCLLRVIDRERLARPRVDLRPRLRGRRPERIAGGESEREQRDRAQVQAAGRDIRFADARLVAAESDPQPAVRVKGVGR